MADPLPVTTPTPAPAPLVSGDPNPSPAPSPAPVATPQPTPQPAANDWSPDWRQRMAGNNPEQVKQLERYATPADVWNKAKALENRLSSGELKAVLPKDATPEQVSAWRKENGIPEAPDKYDFKVRDGLVIGEDDKKIFTDIFGKAHAKNISNEQAGAIVEAYYGVMEQQQKVVAEQRAKAEQITSDTLNKEWGGEYRMNLNRINNVLDTKLNDDGLRKKIDETMKIDPAFAKLMDALARDIMPTSVIVPSGGNMGSTVADEIKAIEADMKKGISDKTSEYYNGAKDPNSGDTVMATRYRALLDHQARSK